MRDRLEADERGGSDGPTRMPPRVAQPLRGHSAKRTKGTIGQVAQMAQQKTARVSRKKRAVCGGCRGLRPGFSTVGHRGTKANERPPVSIDRGRRGGAPWQTVYPGADLAGATPSSAREPWGCRQRGPGNSCLKPSGSGLSDPMQSAGHSRQQSQPAPAPRREGEPATWARPRQRGQGRGRCWVLFGPVRRFLRRLERDAYNSLRNRHGVRFPYTSEVRAARATVSRDHPRDGAR
jgi:hypothetical protein